MTRFEVDSAQVEAASATVRASSAAIAAEVDRMMRALVDLQGSWRGQASTQFQHVAAEWRGTQVHVREGLEAINAALATAGQQYAEAEQRAARLFSR